MPKAPGKQQDKKKRDKRRLMQQAASSPRAWESLDISCWLDNGAGLDQCMAGSFVLDDNGTRMLIYPNELPGEKYFSYWAHEHPDDEREAEAVILIRQILAISYGTAANDADPGRKKPLLNKLEKMAREGCVTASSFLGWCYVSGQHVRKNLTKGTQYICFACDKNEPLACYNYAACLNIPPEKAEKELAASCAAYCPGALQLRAKLYSEGDIYLDNSEMDNLACSLAAFAFKGSWGCLDKLILLLKKYSFSRLKKKYAFAILSLLEKLAAADFVPAMEALGNDHLYGRIGPQKPEKGIQLLLRARSLGSGLAGAMYAAYMLEQLQESDIPGEKKQISAEEKQKVTLAVLKILEEDHSKGLGFPYVDEKLASIYIRSSSEAYFQKAMQILENCIACGYFNVVRYILSIVLACSDNKERHQSVLKVLNSLVRKKNADATFMRARYYLEGWHARKQDREKGLEMMRQAAGMGSGEACFFLAETYLYGLFNCEADIESAEHMARKGCFLYNSDCEMMLGLILLGEFSQQPDKAEETKKGKDEEDPIDMFMCNFNTTEDYADIAWNLMLNGASKPLSDAGVDDVCRDDINNEGQCEYNAEELAGRCLRRVADCNLGSVSFIAHALKKIARTPHAGLYAASFAKVFGFLPDISCDSIALYLQTFIDNAPDSARKFRPQGHDTLTLP